MNHCQSLAYLDKPIDYWIGQLESHDPLARRLAAHALGMIGAQGKAKSVPALLAALEDGESFVRVWAAAALMRVDPSSERAIEVLIRGLQDQRSFVRSLAAWHLGRHALGIPGATAALPALQKLLDDENLSVRAEAELALKVLQIESMRTRGGGQRARSPV